MRSAWRANFSPKWTRRADAIIAALCIGEARSARSSYGRTGMEIGFIGAGRMGFHMVRRLLEAGHKVIVSDTSADAVARVAETRRATGRLAGRGRRSRRDRDGQPADARHRACGRDDRRSASGKKVARFVDLSTTGATMAARTAEPAQGRTTSRRSIRRSAAASAAPRKARSR